MDGSDGRRTTRFASTARALMLSAACGGCRVCVCVCAHSGVVGTAERMNSADHKGVHSVLEPHVVVLMDSHGVMLADTRGCQVHGDLIGRC
jgi:hypothetical protein